MSLKEDIISRLNSSYKEKINEALLDNTDVLKHIMDYGVEQYKKTTSSEWCVKYILNSSGSGDYLMKAVNVVLLYKFLKGDLNKIIVGDKLEIIKEYVRIGLDENTKEARRMVRMALNIDEKRMNSYNLELRKLGIITFSNNYGNNYSLCEELKVLRDYFIINEKHSNREFNLNFKILL